VNAVPESTCCRYSYLVRAHNNSISFFHSASAYVVILIGGQLLLFQNQPLTQTNYGEKHLLWLAGVCPGTRFRLALYPTQENSPFKRSRMSYRELRLLTENLRMLGYPRIVSMDSFRESNFALTAGMLPLLFSWRFTIVDLLIWLTEIYEPRAMIPESDLLFLTREISCAVIRDIEKVVTLQKKKIDTEHDRVALIKFVANTFLTKQERMLSSTIKNSALTKFQVI
jgi:hypothetical protein